MSSGRNKNSKTRVRKNQRKKAALKRVLAGFNRRTKRMLKRKKYE
jgi:hypothetical protein